MHDVRIIPEWKSSLIEKGVCGGVPQNKLTFLCLSHFTRKFWEHNIHIVVRAWRFSILRDYCLDDDGEMILKHLCNGDEKWSLLFQSTLSAVGSSHSQRNFHEVLSCHQLLFSAFAIFALIVTQTFLMSFTAHVVDCLIFLLCFNNHHSKIPSWKMGVS